MYVCKQTIYISWVRITQKANHATMRNFRSIIFMRRQRYISVPLTQSIIFLQVFSKYVLSWIKNIFPIQINEAMIRIFL